MSQLGSGLSVEAHYQALFVAAADAILVANDAGRYVDANPAAARLLGYSRPELLGHLEGHRPADAFAADPPTRRRSHAHLHR